MKPIKNNRLRKKRQSHEEPENHERWLVSYADFITLLFAFFVVMYATSNSDQEKQKDFEESIKSKFHIVALNNKGSGDSGESKDILESALSDLSMPVGQFPKKGGPAETADYVERSLDKSMDADKKKEAIQNITHDAIGARVALASSTFFESGSAKLRTNALPTLDKVAEILKSNNLRIIIEGHTDNTPISDSSFPSNWELAGTRASSVVRYLVKVHKINPKRLVSISYGDQKPIVENDSNEHKSMNRRIEILIVTDDSKAQL